MSSASTPSPDGSPLRFLSSYIPLGLSTLAVFWGTEDHHESRTERRTRSRVLDSCFLISHPVHGTHPSVVVVELVLGFCVTAVCRLPAVGPVCGSLGFESVFLLLLPGIGQGSLDREETDRYILPVTVSDSGAAAAGSLKLTATTSVVVEVRDCNDNPPQFSQVGHRLRFHFVFLLRHLRSSSSFPKFLSSRS